MIEAPKPTKTEEAPVVEQTPADNDTIAYEGAPEEGLSYMNPSDGHYTDLPMEDEPVSATKDDKIVENDEKKDEDAKPAEEKPQQMEPQKTAAVEPSITSATGYTDAEDFLTEEPIDSFTKNDSSSDTGDGYNDDLEVEAEPIKTSAPAVDSSGYLLYDDTEDPLNAQTQASRETITYGGYIAETGSDIDISDGYGDSYGVLDLTEASLNSNAYLLSNQESEPSPSETPKTSNVPETASKGLGFTSAYIDLEIDDPAAIFVLQEGAENEEEDESEDETEKDRTGKSRHMGSMDLLRRSNSSTSLSSVRVRRTNSSVGAKKSNNLNSSTSSAFSAISSYSTDTSTNSNDAFEAPSAYSNPPGGSSANASQSTASHQLNTSGATYFTKEPNSAASSDSKTDSSNYVSFGGPSNATLPSASQNASNASESSTSKMKVSNGSRGSEKTSGNKNLPHPSTLHNAQAIQNVLDAKESWNDRFQCIFDAPESELKYEALHRLSVDFLGVAETYGKVIISEISLPDNEKSIPPINIGGVAGGSKYAVRGVLFKFAVDVPPHFLYGSDEYAQKAAGHELKGLNQWSLNSEGLHFPLMALVRHCGFTLVALSMLPIGGNSLVYGSDDAGRTVHFDDDVIYEKMKQTANALNLKGHYLVADTSKLIYGPGDIEGHLGTDNLHYVLDYARVYPPAALVQGEIREKSRCLFRLLRPELVSRFHLPLSSDAFTAWGRMNSDIHNMEVRQATQYLVDEAIPALAKFLSVDGTFQVWKDLKKDFHLHGVNIRYMGLVRRVCLSEGSDNKHSSHREDPDAAHRWLLREMIVRVLKSVVNQKWRELIKKYQRITPDRCIQEAIGVLNAVIEPQTTQSSKSFWAKTIRDLLTVKFPLALTDEENELVEIKDDRETSEKQEDANNTEQTVRWEAKVDLQQILFGTATSWHFFFTRLSQLTGMEFNPSILEQSCSSTPWPAFGVLTSGDVIEIRHSVQQMSLVDFAFVMSKALNGLRQLSPTLATRLFNLAIERLRASPHISLVILRRIIGLKAYILRTLKRMKWHASLIEAIAEFVDVALDAAQLMCNKVPTDLAVDAAIFLHEIYIGGRQLYYSNGASKIISYLLRAVEADPTNVRPYLEVAKVYLFKSRPSISDEAKEWIAKVLQIAPKDNLIRLQIGLLILMCPTAFIYSNIAFEHREKHEKEAAERKLEREKRKEEQKAKEEAEKSSSAGEAETEKTENEETKEEEEAPYVSPTPQQLGCQPFEQALELWKAVAEENPELFAEIELRMFTPISDDMMPISPAYHKSPALVAAEALTALLHAASEIKCDQLTETLREFLQCGQSHPLYVANPSSEASGIDASILAQAEYTTLVLALFANVPLSSDFFNYLASLGPWNTVTRLIVHGKQFDPPEWKASEESFGNFLSSFPRLEYLSLSHHIPYITGACLSGIKNPRLLTGLDVPGSRISGPDIEALSEEMTRGLQRPENLSLPLSSNNENNSENPKDEDTKEGEGDATKAENEAPKEQEKELAFEPQLPLETLLLPEMEDSSAPGRILQLLYGFAAIKHFATANFSPNLLPALSLFGASIQMVSFAGIKDLRGDTVKEVISHLPNLLMLDCASTGLSESERSAAYFFSSSKLHPKLETIIESSGVLHFYTAGKQRTVYSTMLNHAGKPTVTFELVLAEWPSLALKSYCMPHVDVLLFGERHGTGSGAYKETVTLPLISIARSPIPNVPAVAMARAKQTGLEPNIFVSRFITGDASVSWTRGTTTVAVSSPVSSFGLMSSISYLSDGGMLKVPCQINPGQFLRIKLELPGLKPQQLMVSHGSRYSFNAPTGLHLNYICLAYASLIRSSF